ncbi:MAG: cyclase, partial [Mycobacterium sp.]
AAAVIGTKFSRDMLKTLGIDPVLQDLVSGEFIDQITFTGQPEYVFHHPLVRAVAYESQLKSDRAELHRHVAAAIESRDLVAADENAALIAQHLEAAGVLYAAYGWHMRAATWATNRDIGAARVSWERARQIADALPDDNPDRTARRIAPRTMLCGTAFRAHVTVAGDRFNELRELCTAIGDKASLAIAMAGLVIDHAHQGRMREASQLASEHMALIESVGDPTLTVGLSFAAIYAKFESTEMSDVLRWSQNVIDLADEDPAKGNFIIGSPLAAAFATRAIARYAQGRPGWRDDLQQALAMARSADPLSYARVVTYAYLVGIPFGVLRPDDRVVREIEDALRMAERSGDDHAVSNAQITLGLALVHRPTDAERDRGQKLLAEVSDVFLRLGYFVGDLLLIVQLYLARERARCGDRDEAIPLMRAAVDHLLREGTGSAAPVVLVETLLDSGTDDDVAEADAVITRLADAPADHGLAIREIWLLRLRALLAHAHGDDTAYRDYRDRYGDMARTLGFEGHIAWAEAMP